VTSLLSSRYGDAHVFGYRQLKLANCCLHFQNILHPQGRSFGFADALQPTIEGAKLCAKDAVRYEPLVAIASQAAQLLSSLFMSSANSRVVFGAVATDCYVCACCSMLFEDFWLGVKNMKLRRRWQLLQSGNIRYIITS